jgi:hypothetical protein
MGGITDFRESESAENRGMAELSQFTQAANLKNM